jgi:NTP pyrophosphatase (non-canonical NTP hydrolase)
MTSWHEAYGLILEEVDEFWDEVKKKSHKRPRMDALKELVQIAALCERAALDLALLDDYEKKQQGIRVITGQQMHPSFEAGDVVTPAGRD